MIPSATAATMNFAEATTAAALPASATVSLVRRAREGDEDAFALLYRRHYRMVHGLVLSRVAPRAAEDVTQEVFLTAWRKLPALRDDAAFPGWLHAIARTGAADWTRREGAGDVPLPEEVAAETPDRADALALVAALRSLPEAYRETLTLRLVEGLTGPEISAATGLTEGSVRVNLHRGLRRLRELLQGNAP